MENLQMEFKNLPVLHIFLHYFTLFDWFIYFAI